MKHKSMKRLFCVYAIIMLLLLLVSVLVLLHALKEKEPLPNLETEVIFVYLSDSEAPTAQLQTDSESNTWILREYQGKIAVFDENGELVKVLDSYVKSLPAADQALLREGLAVHSREALWELIQDYTS